MSDYYYQDDSEEFDLDFSDIAPRESAESQSGGDDREFGIDSPYPFPFLNGSSDEFFERWASSSSDVISTPFEPEKQTTKQCAQCGSIAWPDGLGGFICPECGDDVEVTSSHRVCV